jgi:iron complex outermembrane receptor protein
MIRFRAKTVLLAAGAAVGTMIPTAAFAQSTPSPTATGGTSGQPPEIIVTAQKRDVALQRATLSVTAVTADLLAQSNITEITGLNGQVPGLTVARSGGGERIISIRGVGSSTPENTNTQPGVSYHIDGVYVFNSIAANAAFIDIAQVEVLRGPQGTTFGQGSTGGTINVVTNQPSTQALAGTLDVSAGNYSFIKADAALNVPLSSTLAVRGAIQHVKHDGYGYATAVPGQPKYELDDENNTGWKAALLWSPAPNFSLSLNTVQYRSDTHGPEQKNIIDPAPDPRMATQDFPGQSVIKTELYYGVAKFDAGFATIKSITSYQKLFSHQAWDSDGLTSALFFAATYHPQSFVGVNYDHVPEWRTRTKSWTQEFNIASNGDGPFQWIAGGVYLWSKNSQYIVEYRSGADTNILRAAIPATTAYNAPAVAAITYAELSGVTRKSWAAYVEATYAITPDLKVIGGIRSNDDSFNGESDSMSGGKSKQTSGAYLQPKPRVGLDTHAWTGKAAVQYQATPDNMVYLSFTRGFKPGGINSAASSGGSSFLQLGWQDGIKPTFKPESVDSFEIGSKNRFFDSAVQLNLSAFLYNYRNLQFIEQDPILFGQGISNAPRARIYGLEMEGYWRITPHVRAEGSIALLNGKFNKDYNALNPVLATNAQNAAGYPDYLFYTNYLPAIRARASARRNINGNDVPQMPAVQGNVSLIYSNRVGPGELTAKGQYIYRGKYQYQVFNNGIYDRTPAYSQVNLFVKYQPDNTGLWVSLTATNLFDVAGINSRFTDPYGSSQTANTYIAPRQVFGTVGFKF